MNEDGTDRRGLLKALAVLGLAATDATALPTVQNATTVDPRAYHVIMENEKVRVVEHLSRPRMGVCGTGMHSHPDHVTIALTDIRAKVTLPNGETFTADNKAGDAFFEPAVTHTVENVGGRDVRAYLVELKQA